MRVMQITKVDVAVTTCCWVVLLMLLGAVGQAGSEQVRQQMCKKNLSRLGKVMAIYANDYEDEYPKAGGRTNEWVSEIANWKAQSRRDAYSIERTQGKVTITSSLYLLIKYAEMTPKDFVCPGEAESCEFDLAKVPEDLPDNYQLIDAWDFGGWYDEPNNPSRHCSYAYHMPFDHFALTLAADAEMAIIADRNPWMDPKLVSDPNWGWKSFQSGNTETLTHGNSDAHDRRGQNILFGDLGVRFEETPICGVDQDNIYTLASDADDNAPRPKVYDTIRPTNRRDSVLVQDIGYKLLEK